MEHSIAVFSTNGVKTALLAAMPDCERATGHRLAVSWASTKTLMDRIVTGESADLYVLTDEAIDDLAMRGLVRPSSRIDLARSGIGVAVRKGAARPDIATPAALIAALRAARTVGLSRSGISARHFHRVLDRLGIAGEIGRKVVYPDGEPVGALVARGDADLGIQQIGELMAVEGIDILGPIPEDVQKVTVFSLGISTKAPADRGVSDLARHLKAAFTADLLGPRGFDPA